MTQQDKDKKPKPYHTPKLEVHGELSTLTQQAGSGGGGGGGFPFPTSMFQFPAP